MENNKKTIKEVRDQYFGKSGDIESESILIDNNADKQEGHISIWSNKNDIAKILDRCGSMVIDYKEQGGGYSIKISRKAFRGVSYAFKKIGGKTEDDDNDEQA